MNWRPDQMIGTLTGSSKPNSDFHIFRSALILHGREMINQAIERDWCCSTPEESFALVHGMVESGAWYLERAGDDVEGMLENSNWEEMLKEDHRIMLSLFNF